MAVQENEAIEAAQTLKKFCAEHDCDNCIMTDYGQENKCRLKSGYAEAWNIEKMMDNLTPLKVFISQPMRGKSDEDIRRDRQRVIELAKREIGKKIVIIDRYKPELENMKPVEAMAVNIGKLTNADVVCFADGWKYARGCRVEHDVAREYGIKMIEE